MDNQLIIYPVVINILLTLYLYEKSRRKTVRAYRNKDVNKGYAKLYKGEAPEYLEIYRQTLKNQFELPIIFYLLISLIVSIGKINFLDIIFAWLFVISRYVHCYIRLTSNYIPYRSKTFTAGVFLLILGWINFLAKL